MAIYPFLPMPPAAIPGESLTERGTRILIWLLREGVFATCTDEELHAADRAALIALQSPDISPKAVDTVSAVRADIALTFRARARFQAPAAVQDVPVVDVPPAGGKGARLVQAPVFRPPSGALAVSPDDF